MGSLEHSERLFMTTKTTKAPAVILPPLYIILYSFIRNKCIIKAHNSP